MESIVQSNHEWSNPLYMAIPAIGLMVGYHVLFRPQTNHDQLPPVPNIWTLKFMHEFIVGTEGPQFVLKVARNIGSYIIRSPGITKPYWILIGEPTISRKILEDPRSLKPYIIYEIFDKAAGGETFFPVNGPRVAHVRKSTAAAFSPQSVKYMASVVEEVVENWIETRLEPLYVQAQKPLDFDAEMILVTTDVIARAAFDYSLSAEERTEFAEKLRKVMEVFSSDGLNLIRRFFGVCFADIREAKRLANELRTNFAHRFIKACRNNPSPNKNSVVYLMLQDDEYENDDQRARDIMLYFFGGFETTAHSISWTMLELARNLQEQTKLQTALADYVRQNSSGNSNNPDIKQCPQLKHVSREILRLHTPAALGSARVAAEDIVIPDTNQTIPKGSICFVVLYMLLRNHTIFSNADSFDPSRWESPTEEMQRAFLPFAAGKRNCQGQALANLELNYAVGRVLCKYKLKVVDEGEPYYMITLRPKGSLILVSRLDDD